MQRIAGNHGLGTLLAEGRAVQRLGTTSGAVGAHLGKSKAKGVAGMGSSSFAVIQKALADFEQQKRQMQVLPPGGRKAAEPQLVSTLERLDRLATKWINTHTKDAERRGVLMKLVDELATERVTLSQKQAQDVYLDNLAVGGTSRSVLSPFTGSDSQKFEAASGTARGNAFDARTGFFPELRAAKLLAPDGGVSKEAEIAKRLRFMAKYGITAAEGAAIRTYTEEAPEFRYMNASAANSPGWIEALRAPGDTNQVTARQLANVNQKKIMEEGSLHTAMAVSGLARLPPYRGNSFRGETVTEAEFKAKTKIGDTVSFPNLISTSAIRANTHDFLKNNVSDKRPIGLLSNFTNSGGRELKLLSAEQGEGEVILLPGTALKIVSVNPTKIPGLAPSWKVYEVHTLPMPTTKAPPAPKPPPPAPPIPAGGLPPLSAGQAAPAPPPFPPGGLPPMPPR